MARKYTVQEIDGVKYELHPVKIGEKPIGFVPIRVINTIADIQAMMKDHQIDEGLVIQDFLSGYTVRMQRLARELAGGEKFTDAVRKRILNTLSKETVAQYAGRWDELEAHAKAVWQKEQADGSGVYDETKVYEELI